MQGNWKLVTEGRSSGREIEGDFGPFFVQVIRRNAPHNPERHEKWVMLSSALPAADDGRRLVVVGSADDDLTAVIREAKKRLVIALLSAAQTIEESELEG